ncbi:MAG: hypothetical protein R3293_18255, partial [Candidatus Promineifilaceae bacterium]|nr:hypothetical protein [Candidatus Promineifilaceae bacterium]
MRPLELLLLLLLLLVLVWPLLPWRRPRWVDFLPVTAVLLLIIQILIEGYRWQMLPAYVLVLIVFLLTLPLLFRPARREPVRSGWTIAGSFFGLLVWLMVIALPLLMPVPKLPEVSGAYKIGTRTFHLVDESRE